MDIQNTGTAEKSAPSEDKFEKATEAMKGLMNSKTDEPSKEGTSEEKEEKAVEEKSEEKRENWQDRYKHVQSYADKMATKAEQIAITLVSKDPDAIHDIAKTDIELADKIVAKELSKEFGITTYAGLVETLNKQTTKKEEKGDESETEKRLKVLEEAKAKDDEKSAKAYVDQFKKDHSDFKGDIEKKTWELFDSSNLTLDQAYKLTVLESSDGKKESEIEEKIYSKLAAQKVASNISSSSTKSTSSKNTKQITSTERDFLESIGAKKTLSKFN